MEGYSRLAVRMQRAQRELEEKQALAPVPAWPIGEDTPEKRAARIAKSMKDFWAFDRIYFPADMYLQGYAKPCAMHKDIERFMRTPGVHAVGGPRGHGKTVTVKKVGGWQLLTGLRHLTGTYSQTIDVAENILDDVVSLLKDNDRIMSDWGLDFLEDNATQAQFRTVHDPRLRVIAAFSEGRSVRGFSKLFGRPELILGDDIETLTSPLGDEHVELRVSKVSEAYLSLVDDGTFLWLGNNFDTKCALNRLLEKQKAGLLDDGWHIHIYPAWDGKRPLWKERYPAKSEEDMRRMSRAKDRADWMGNFQQQPIAPDGDIFPEAHYDEYIEIPNDAAGVAWCDPNLSLKDKGDGTATGALLYSPTTNLFYIRDGGLESFADSNLLLDTYLEVKRADIGAMGFDGNVTQEATWTNHVRAWCHERERPFPRLEYRKYNVDLLMKTVSADWYARRFRFPPGFRESPQGKRFMEQIFAFKGKKAGKPDDAADWLISAHTLLHERGYVRPKTDSKEAKVIVIKPRNRF